MLIIVTNRKLCKDDFLQRIEKIAQCRPEKIILREKDLTKGEYLNLALQCKEICSKYGVTLTINSFYQVAKSIEIKSIHIPFDVFMSKDTFSDFDEIGVSVHSVEEAKALNNTKATYIIAGHVFETDCKKGLKPRGLEFLKGICEISLLPVYGIGGINSNRILDVKNTGAKGACVMSEMMTCKDIERTIMNFYK